MVEGTMRAAIARKDPIDDAASAAAAAGGGGGGGATTLSVSVEDVPMPRPDFIKEKECLVKVIRAGVCATDLEILKGYMGFEGCLGHEFVGIVESSPPGYEHLIGKRVCADINVACCNLQFADLSASNRRFAKEGKEEEEEVLQCKVCNLDEKRDAVDMLRRNHCPNRTVLGILGRPGCFSEYLTMPVRNLHVVQDCVTDAEACFSEPLAAALRIVEQQLLVQRGEEAEERQKIAVLGDGKLGLLITAALTATLSKDRQATLTKTTIFMLGRHNCKLELLKEMQRSVKGVVDLVLVNVKTDEGKRILQEEESGGGSCDIVVEATGSPDGFQQACTLLKPRGKLVLKSTCAAGIEKGLNLASLVIDELFVVGSRCGPIDKALEMLAERGPNSLVSLFPLEKMVDATYPLSSIGKAFEKARERGTLKVVVTMT